MSDVYYRGSSTYEVAVQNRLKSLERAGAETNYAVRAMGAEISGAVRENTYALVASQALLAKTFAQGFDSMNNTISLGFSNMESKLDEVADRICSKLDEIHDIVNNPLLTASRELYRRALTNYDKGFYEEALEDCKAAVEKNKTDAISWDLLGQIYLYGAGKFSNVIDLDKAEESLSNAAKYVDPDIGKSDEANELASEIYYNLGYVRLVKSNDLLVQNKAEESNSKLLEAESASGKAYQISKDNLLAAYEQAKELHFLGKDDEALKILKKIILEDQNFALRASCDRNFETLWGKIDELIERMKEEVEEELKQTIQDFEPTVEKLSKLEEKKYKKQISEIQQSFSKAKNGLGKEYFTVRNALETDFSDARIEYTILGTELSLEALDLAKFVSRVANGINSNENARIEWFEIPFTDNEINPPGVYAGVYNGTDGWAIIVSYYTRENENLEHENCYLSNGYVYDSDRPRISPCIYDSECPWVIPYIKENLSVLGLRVLSDEKKPKIHLMRLIHLIEQREECWPNEILHSSLEEFHKALDALKEKRGSRKIGGGSINGPNIYLYVLLPAVAGFIFGMAGGDSGEKLGSAVVWTLILGGIGLWRYNKKKKKMEE